MIVKNKVSPIEKIRELIKHQDGILQASDLEKYGIPRTYLSIMIKKGELQRVSRGVYSAAADLADEMAALQARYKGAIFSHETSLYLLDLSDRTPLFYSVSVPSGYNASSLKASGAKVYFVNRRLYTLGLISLKSPNGHAIKTFGLERTICDVLRSRNQIDVQLLNVALKCYVQKAERNIDLLYEYALQFRVQKIVRQTIEVLL